MDAHTTTLRTAVITGAAAGIGAACTRLLLKRGYAVAAVGRHLSQLEALASTETRQRLIPIVADVRDAARMAAAFSRLERIDCLVANAGICLRTPLDGPDTAPVWDDIIDTNINGVWRTFRAASPKLGAGSAAVAVSSGLGKLGRAGYSAYAASKHAVLGIVKCLALELAPKGIRVNAVCPGWVDTEMAKRDLAITAEETGTTVDRARADAEGGIPLGRFVSADETANLICWLLSDEAGAVTGQSYNISCGEFTV